MPANTTEETREKIIELHAEGHIISEIARKLSITRQTVYRWVKNHCEENRLDDRPRSGRRSLIDEQKRKKLIAEYIKDGFQSTKKYAEIYGVSSYTVRRALRKEGLCHQRPIPKEILKSVEKTEYGRVHLWRPADDKTSSSEPEIEEDKFQPVDLEYKDADHQPSHSLSLKTDPLIFAD